MTHRGPEESKEDERDRSAIEHILGRRVGVTPWPAAAMPAGTRVRVIHDPEWKGPWQREFLGTVDSLGAPQPVRHPNANPGELAYWVRFDETQFDADGDGPYRKALIWDRYLQGIEPGP